MITPTILLLDIKLERMNNYSEALGLPSPLSHFEASQWSAPEPLSTPIYTPPRETHPHAL